MGKIKVLTEAKVVADVSGYRMFYSRTAEEEAKKLESAVREFRDFVRDHRSMDWLTLTVERRYQYQCSYCKREWEEDQETGEPVCCDKAIEEFNGHSSAPELVER